MSDDILAQLRRRPPRVTVVGDVILDRWVRGRVRRVSREAPVPVVDARAVESSPGGAANTAVNLAALGARVELVSVVGRDAEGAELLRLLGTHGVGVSGVAVSEGVTATKTRVVGEDQILVRVDRAASPARAVLGEPATDALVVCDYGGGLLDDAFIESLSHSPRPRLVVVDAHEVARWAPLHPDVVTPNALETEVLLGSPLSGSRVDAVTSAASTILRSTGAASAVVTLDVEGTVVLEDGRVTGRTSAVPAAEQQASGAGDTFAAALTVALCAGAGLPDAAAFAQRAADVVVGRPGTAVCTTADLAAPGSVLLSHTDLARRIDEERARGRRIVFANGCFDLIHRGHTTHLHQAKALGDVLVVALNDDDSVRQLKGPGRPVNPLTERAAVLQELGCVDYVTAFPEDSPVALIERLRPEIYTKGGDYTPEMVPEAEAVRAYGGEVRILDYLPHRSTTETVARIIAGGRGG